MLLSTSIAQNLREGIEYAAETLHKRSQMVNQWRQSQIEYRGVCVCYRESKQRWAGRIDYAISGVWEWNMEQEEGARV